MSQEWLNGLATLYIGKKSLDTIMLEPSLMILYLEMLEDILRWFVQYIWGNNRTSVFTDQNFLRYIKLGNVWFLSRKITNGVTKIDLSNRISRD
jgi:hypothetical protein